MNVEPDCRRHLSWVLQPRDLSLTAHAALRARQRGVDLSFLAILLAYGRREHDHRGAEVVVFDRDAMVKLKQSEASAIVQAVERTRNLLAVVDSAGWVVTMGHRCRRVVRDRSLSSLRPRARRRRRGLPYPLQ